MADNPNFTAGNTSGGTASTNVEPKLPSPTSISKPSPTVASNSGQSFEQLKADSAKLGMYQQGRAGGK